MKPNTKYLIIVVAVVLLIGVIAAFGMRSSYKNESNGQNNASTAQTSQNDSGTSAPDTNTSADAQSPSSTEEPVVMPTFMYFVSKTTSFTKRLRAFMTSLKRNIRTRSNSSLRTLTKSPI